MKGRISLRDLGPCGAGCPKTRKPVLGEKSSWGHHARLTVADHTFRGGEGDLFYAYGAFVNFKKGYDRSSLKKRFGEIPPRLSGHNLKSELKEIYSTRGAFVALKEDGSVVPPGGYGHHLEEIWSKGSGQWRRVEMKEIYGFLGYAFAALKKIWQPLDTWGQKAAAEYILYSLWLKVDDEKEEYSKHFWHLLPERRINPPNHFRDSENTRGGDSSLSRSFICRKKNKSGREIKAIRAFLWR